MGARSLHLLVSFLQSSPESHHIILLGCKQVLPLSLPPVLRFAPFILRSFFAGTHEHIQCVARVRSKSPQTLVPELVSCVEKFLNQLEASSETSSPLLTGW